MSSESKIPHEASGLTVDSLSKSYNSPGGELEVLRDVSFSLASGEVLAVTGPSGSGKSTLLNLIAALIEPSGGTMTLDGCDIDKLPLADRPEFRARNIGMVFQDHLLIEHLTAMDNILLAAMAIGSVTQDTLERAEKLMATLGISDRAEHLPGELSGGQKQRVAIARAMINSPKLLLADEPTGQLDKDSSAEVLELLLKAASQDKAIVILVTHDLALARSANKIFTLDKGKTAHKAESAANE